MSILMQMGRNEEFKYSSIADDIRFVLMIWRKIYFKYNIGQLVIYESAFLFGQKIKSIKEVSVLELVLDISTACNF